MIEFIEYALLVLAQFKCFDWRETTLALIFWWVYVNLFSFVAYRNPVCNAKFFTIESMRIFLPKKKKKYENIR